MGQVHVLEPVLLDTNKDTNSSLLWLDLSFGGPKNVEQGTEQLVLVLVLLVVAWWTGGSSWKAMVMKRRR